MDAGAFEATMRPPFYDVSSRLNGIKSSTGCGIALGASNRSASCAPVKSSSMNNMEALGRVGE